MGGWADGCGARVLACVHACACVRALHELGGGLGVIY